MRLVISAACAKKPHTPSIFIVDNDDVDDCGDDGDTSSGDDGGPPLVVKMRSETGPFQTILHNLVLTKESAIIHSWEII